MLSELLRRSRPRLAYFALSPTSSSISNSTDSPKYSPWKYSPWKYSPRKYFVSSRNFSSPSSAPPPPSILTQFTSIPNVITTSRLFLTPYLSYLLLHPSTSDPTLLLPTLTSSHLQIAALCFYLPFSDYADGYLARHYDMSTPLGSFLDPFADKFLLLTLSSTLLISTQYLPDSDIATLLYPEVLALWISRDAMLLGMGWAVLGNAGMSSIVSDGGEDDAATIKPSLISKGNTVLQMSTLSLSVLYLGLGDIFSPEVLSALKFSIEGMAISSVFTTVGSAVGYVDGQSLTQHPKK